MKPNRQYDALLIGAGPSGSTAAALLKKLPPSEKESGVVFRIPITSVRSPSTMVRLRQFQ